VRKDIDHLRPMLQRQLERAVETLRTEFAEAIKGKAWERGKQGRILKIVLYGSMARGTQVTDMRSGYRSDFDLLVIVSHKELADDDWWYGANDALIRTWLKSSNRREVNFIVHDLADVNDQLRRGRPFFKDIDRDGIIVYEYDTKPLARPGNLSAEEIREEAQGHFEQWYKRTLNMAELSVTAAERGMLNEAAFLLHQAVEAAYHCLLLTLTLYSPQLHKIEKLRAMAEGLDQRLIEAWPRKTRHQRRPFDKIRRAYVEARYSKHYRITKEMLEEATASVEALQGIVKMVCDEQLVRA
jgi:predicted nucleotidyltransferase/HEPN domain-containing protein